MSTSTQRDQHGRLIGTYRVLPLLEHRGLWRNALQTDRTVSEPVLVPGV
jgi:hypothetical protein